MTVSEDSIFVEEQSNLKAINIKTAPYPGFATDLQQPITPTFTKSEWSWYNCRYDLRKTCKSCF